MANYPIYRLVKGTTLTFTEMDGNLEWLSRNMSASVVTITGSTFVFGNLNVSSGITGSLFGTSSWSERSMTASVAISAVSASYLSGSTAIVSNLTSSLDANINELTIGRGKQSNIKNMALGYRALENVSGSSYFDNVAVGYLAMLDSTEAFENTAVGSEALRRNKTGTQNTVLGASALSFPTYSYGNVAIGNSALAGGIGGDVYESVAVGFAAAANYHSQRNTVIGFLAGWASRGANNVIIGHRAGYNVSNAPETGSNTIIGTYAGGTLATATYNTILGYNSGLFIYTGTYNTLLGANIFFTGSDNKNYNTIIGSNISGLSGPISNNVILADGQGNVRYRWNGVSNVFSGSVFVSGSITGSNALLNGTLTVQTIVAQTITASTEWITGSSKFGSLVTDTHQFTGSVLAPDITGSLFGTASWATNTVSSSYPISVSGSTLYSRSPIAGLGFSTNNSIFLGTSAGFQARTSANSNFFGSEAGYESVNANSSNFFGFQAGYSSSQAYESNFLGYRAGYQAVSARNSNFLGLTAGWSARFARNSNFFGDTSGYDATYASDSNFFGRESGFTAISASYSTFLGYRAGYQATNASYSVFLGHRAGDGSAITLGANNIIIGNNITLPAGTVNSINLGAIIFATGSYSTVSGNPFTGTTNGRVGINQPNPIFSLDVSGSGRYTTGLIVTGSLIAPNITGSLFGTSSWAVSASWAPSSPSVAGISSYISTGSITASVNPDPTASFKVTSGSNTLLTLTKDSKLVIGTPGEFIDYQLEVSGAIKAYGNVVVDLSQTIASTLYGTGQLVTASADQPTIYLESTWDTSANARGIEYSVTNTTSGVSSSLLNLKIDNASVFKVSKGGTVQTTEPGGSTIGPQWKLGIPSTGTITPDTYITVEINGQVYSIPALLGTP